jgi:hypothetical protein
VRNLLDRLTLQLARPSAASRGRRVAEIAGGVAVAAFAGARLGTPFVAAAAAIAILSLALPLVAARRVR